MQQDELSRKSLFLLDLKLTTAEAIQDQIDESLQRVERDFIGHTIREDTLFCDIHRTLADFVITIDDKIREISYIGKKTSGKR